MPKEKLVIVIPCKEKSAGWKPIMVKAHVYEKVQEMCDKSGLSKGELATKMLDFAIERTELQDEN